ncbi:hypothetical protein [Micromonospora sp. NPDC126480]|uniref:hypothetical protein n=1 Tax=Micromonospora sp. NPDC126480 TaxID=3155312 RepID=UPI00332E29D5
MPSAASAHPLWGAVLRSLREMTRLAVAVLALTTGLGAAASVAPPPAAASTAHETVASHVVDAAVSPVTAPTPPQHRTDRALIAPHPTVAVVAVPQPVRPSLGTASASAARETVAGAPLVVEPIVEPIGEPIAGVPAPTAHGAAPPEPGPGAMTRRGPPSA